MYTTPRSTLCTATCSGTMAQCHCRAELGIRIPLPVLAIATLLLSAAGYTLPSRLAHTEAARLREAIRYAWQFVTDRLKLDPARLWVTVYCDDDDAADIWLNDIGVTPERVKRMGEASNFWAMGDTGPCGPCSEIFYDHGPEVAGGPPGSRPEARSSSSASA